MEHWMERAIDLARNLGEGAREAVADLVPEDRQEEVMRTAKHVAGRARRLVEDESVNDAIRDLGRAFRRVSDSVRERVRPAS